MDVQIHNSLTGKKEIFTATSNEPVRMYTCGVTVYDDCHIGHARSLYIFEVIRRFLGHVYRRQGKSVTFIRNITDVDDKIIAKARKEADQNGGSLREAFDRVRERYIESYYEDMRALQLPAADEEPRATDNISAMQDYISQLIEKGAAYAAEGNVYFRVRKFSGYGALSGKKIDDLHNAVRIESDPGKQDPLDFALWKKAKDGEPSWDSPWGNGRPGWHIECSVMSQRYLNSPTLDIHGGGRDLIFPHHENERAQAEALTGETFARYWIHHGLLTINGQKMAKSLGNFFTIKDVLTRFSPDVLKLFFLHAHYASPIDFSWEKMEEARKAYERIDIFRQKIFRLTVTSDDCAAANEHPAIQPFRKAFMGALADDFNMPRALAAFFDYINSGNKMIDEHGGGDQAAVWAMHAFFKEVSALFCLNFSPHQQLSDDAIEAKIEQRLAHKKARNFAAADALRDELQQAGVILEDTKDGTTWRLKV